MHIQFTNLRIKKYTSFTSDFEVIFAGMEPHWLILETSHDLCAVAIGNKDGVVAHVHESGRKQASMITVLIDQAVQESGIHLDHLQAVAVNEGPGSYTGLRVGFSAAKGLCYALNIPLITYSGFENLYNQLDDSVKTKYNNIYSLIHARKDEYFYQQILVSDATPSYAYIHELIQIHPHDSLYICLDQELIPVFEEHHISYQLLNPLTAANSNQLVAKKFQNQLFADLAYSDPLYIKEFQTKV